jgi:hypothetical protein
VSRARRASNAASGASAAFPPHSACPRAQNNLLTTLFDLKEAIMHDFFQALRLGAICFGKAGFSGCICAVLGTLEPFWRKRSNNPSVRCEDNDDPFLKFIPIILDRVILWVEGMVNDNLIGPINGLFNQVAGWLGINNPIPNLCLPTPTEPVRCMLAPFAGLFGSDTNTLAECYDSVGGPQYQASAASNTHTACTTPTVASARSASSSACGASARTRASSTTTRACSSAGTSRSTRSRAPTKTPLASPSTTKTRRWPRSSRT